MVCKSGTLAPACPPPSQDFPSLAPGLWGPAGTVEAWTGFQLTHEGETGSCVSFSTSEMVLVKSVHPVL